MLCFFIVLARTCTYRQEVRALLMDVFPLPLFLIRICGDSLFGLVPFEKKISFCDERQKPWNLLMLNETLDYLLY
jgi:hypothetical protein